MMINKRLIGAVPESKKYIAGNVALQWCSLCANIAMMSAVTALLAALYAGSMTQSKIVTTAVIALAAVAVRYGCTVGASRMGYLSSKAVKKTLRGAIYDKLLCLGASYSEQVKTSEVVQVAVEGVDQLETYFGAYLPQFFYAMLAPLTLFVVLCFVSVPAAVVLLVCVPLIPVAIAALFTLIMCLFIGHYHALLSLLALAAYICVGVVIPLITSRRSGDTGMRFRTESGALSAFVLDSLRGLNETIQYDRGAERRAEMDARTDALSKEEAKLKRLTGQNMGITNTAILIFDLAMLVSSAALVQRGELTFDGALIAVLALFSSFGPTVALANLGATLQNTFAAGNRVLDILDEAPVVDEVTGQPEVEFTGAEAEHVTFSYGGEDILSDVSVRFPEGSVVGIVGRSGSGKSTLLKLLMRFWDVQKGRVRLSGTDVSRINTGNLREMESFVTQETHLFHDSIKNNLRIAKLDATDDEIVAACKKAAVHEFIMTLPQGYDTPVGELGDTLSGGERQRLGLARAFLHDAPLMLLDEPTSNLDSLNEAVILKSLYEQCAGKSVVLVSHRASTMRIADTVYSVEHGRMS